MLTADNIFFFKPPINFWKICIDLRLFSKFLVQLFLRPLRSKDVRCRVVRLQPQKFVIVYESLATNLEKVWQMVSKFWLWYLSFCITYKSLWGIIKKTKNQNFGTVCHKEVCLNFSRLAAKFSEMITTFWGRALKIQHRKSFDLNGLKNGLTKNFEKSLLIFGQSLEILAIVKQPHWLYWMLF